MAELAVRLGSPVSFDRSGSASWYDDFATGLSKWTTNSDDPGTSIVTQADMSNTGAFCVKLTTAAVLLTEALLYRYAAPPRIGTFGLTIAFASILGGGTLAFEVRRILDDVAHYMKVSIQPSTGNVYIDTNDSGQVLVATIGSIVDARATYHYLKIVVDFDTDKYVRLILDTNRYDLSDHDMLTVAAIAPDSYQTEIALRGGAFASNEVLIDSVIYTYDEIV
jgi:hypothetical protein